MTRFTSLFLLPFLGAGLACSSADPEPATATPEPSAETAPVAEAPAAEADPHADHGEHAAAAEAPEPVRELEDGSRIYGSEPSDRETTELAALMADPGRFAGQVVKTEGEIVQVCQRMGCWMELTAGEDGDAIRVPMAGHSFFLPRDVAGRRATVEGTVEVAELDADTQQHLREEGAQAADQALSIQATAVVVH